MAFPVFFLYAIYGVVNTYLPLFLKNMGYSITAVGILLACFEFSGVLFPFVISSYLTNKAHKVNRKKKYACVLLFFAILMVILPFPFILKGGFWYTALFLGLYAIGFKGAVPFSDTLINASVGEKPLNYGKVRMVGSIGFVCMTLILQAYGKIQVAKPFEVILWMTLPAFFFVLALLAKPALFQKDAPVAVDNQNIAEESSEKNLFSVFPKAFWIGMVFIFLYFLGTIPSGKFLPLYVEDYLHVNGIALLFALSATAEIPFMFFSSIFLKRFSSIRLIIFCCIALSFRSLIYVLFPTFYGAVFGQLLNSITYGLFHTAVVLFIVEQVPQKYIVVGQALYSLVIQGLANVFGSILGGSVVDLFGYKTLFVSFAVFPLISACIYIFIRKKVMFDSISVRKGRQ